MRSAADAATCLPFGLPFLLFSVPQLDLTEDKDLSRLESSKVESNQQSESDL